MTGLTYWFLCSRSIPQDPKYNLSAKDRIVIVMGPTGAGKSTFIEYATQQAGESVGHSLESKTSEIRAVRCQHLRDHESVIFVDTPGFDDTHRSDIEILSQIAGWFVKAYKQKVPISAIIYLHRISDNRMAGSPLKNLQMFASMCGQEAMPRVVLATTMWGETTTATGERREKELKGTFWTDMIAQGCTVQRFGDSYPSAWQLVGKLPTVQENVILSREIFDDKKKLNETAAGVKLTEELNRLISDQKEAARRLEEQVNSQHDPVLVAELQQRKVDIELKIGGVTTQLQQLKVPFGRKIMNFITGKRARKSGVYVPGNRR
ncbi:hypothetical protein FIBSPDRAFT_1037208 [Athelia psychrophila]|uniref:G domain-containing protein n=1 Tax=Athelia psychrophila TaxID=1759441 RepID=A0A166UXE8_9AGAM|nr:hypothetical protein FIBSPDRAFT_1037208 [Fibularhizoctonia sp. CBS 109695]